MNPGGGRCSFGCDHPYRLIINITESGGWGWSVKRPCLDDSWAWGMAQARAAAERIGAAALETAPGAGPRRGKGGGV